MAINATTSGTKREVIEPNNYIARCYKMLEIGTVQETIMGEVKTLKKVRIGWELPTELRLFNEEKGMQPIVIDKEYTLSMHEKSSLRKDLKSWRGKDFTEEEARSFDITKLIGAQCMLNIILKPSKKDQTIVYNDIAGITPMPKGFECPPAVNPKQLLEFDNFNQELFDYLPDFIKDKIKSSEEYKQMIDPHNFEVNQDKEDDDIQNLPF